jgi:hypothetical protein
MVAGYAHWIPITRGLYKDCFNLNFPGWEWNQIIPILINKGIIKVDSKEEERQELSQGLSISKNVEGILLRPFKYRTEVTVNKIPNH